MTTLEKVFLKVAAVFGAAAVGFLLVFWLTGATALLLLSYGHVLVVAVMIAFYLMTRYGGR
jgi:hypothetical protein